jgi:hypothetical protein
LRRRGKKEEADAVRALRKPTVSAWAVNQVARQFPEETRALVKAGDELRKAQRAAVSGRDPGVLRAGQRAHRERLDEVTSLARDALGLSGPTAQRVAQTLRAASVDKEASKSLVAGTLSGDVEQVGFGPLLSAVPSGRRAPRAKPKPKPKPKPKVKPAAKPKPPPKPKPDPNVKRRAKVQEQLDKARARVRELEMRLEDLGG